jgi:formate-nitrite transporter family protein
LGAPGGDRPGGGTDVATGVLALLLVLHATGPTASGHLWAGLAFSVGFIALTLARSEPFTENFLVPVTTVVVKQATTRSLLRLWSVTLVANLISGRLITALIMAGFPQLSYTAIDDGGVYVGYGIGWRSFALALLAGAIVTLMTWMQHGFESYGVKLVGAITTGFLLAAGSMNHTVVSSLLISAACTPECRPTGPWPGPRPPGGPSSATWWGASRSSHCCAFSRYPRQVQQHRERPAELTGCGRPA